MGINAHCWGFSRLVTHSDIQSVSQTLCLEIVCGTVCVGVGGELLGSQGVVDSGVLQSAVQLIK